MGTKKQVPPRRKPEQFLVAHTEDGGCAIYEAGSAREAAELWVREMGQDAANVWDQDWELYVIPLSNCFAIKGTVQIKIEEILNPARKP